jgi:aminoglycoside 2''-phosphotransferase
VISFLGEGDFTSAWLAEDMVLRFAKHPAADESLQREAALLPQLDLPLEIPRPSYCKVSANPLVAFAAHKLLKGEILTRDRFLTLDSSTQDRCTEQLANFVHALHRCDLQPARDCGVPEKNYVFIYGALLERFESDLACRLETADRDYVTAMLGRILETEAAELNRFVLLHGDLGPAHILFDPAQQRISGVIDFGDMAIGDLAWDLTYLYEDYGAEFMRRFLKYFTVDDPERLLLQVYRFYELDAVEWAVRVSESTQATEAISHLTMLRIQRNQSQWRAALPE